LDGEGVVKNLWVSHLSLVLHLYLGQYSVTGVTTVSVGTCVSVTVTQIASTFIHPDIAALVDPLFTFGGKRGGKRVS
jgi:hypothetical protein